MAIALLKPIRGRQPLPFGAIHSPRSRSKTAPRSGELGCKRSGNAQAAAVSSSDIMPRPPYRFFLCGRTNPFFGKGGWVLGLLLSRPESTWVPAKCLLYN